MVKIAIMAITISPANIPTTREEGIAILLGISHLMLKGIRRIKLKKRLEMRICQITPKNLFSPRDRE
jgi:hypothetical protein